MKCGFEFSQRVWAMLSIFGSLTETLTQLVTYCS
jgi:hypothetical protein